MNRSKHSNVYVAIVRSAVEAIGPQHVDTSNVVEMRVFGTKAAAYRWLTALKEGGELRWRVATVDECPYNYLGSTNGP